MQLRALVVVGLLASFGCKKAEPTATAAAQGSAASASKPIAAPAAQKPAAAPGRPSLQAAPRLPEYSDANPPGVPRLTGELQNDRGVSYIDEVVGTGASPRKGKTVKVHYTGWLTDGTKFDSSRDRGDPIAFPFDDGHVIPGWDIGLASMRAGGKRRIVIPGDLGYGERGAGEAIPPDSVLVFDVELVEAD